MSDVQQGAPPSRSRQVAQVDWTALIEKAAANPGEWFNTPVPDGLHAGNVSGSLSFAISKHVAEFATRQGVVYLRFTDA